MMTVAYGENEIFGEFPTKRQLTLLLQSWCEIQNELEEVGIETFRKLFESHSGMARVTVSTNESSEKFTHDQSQAWKLTSHSSLLPIQIFSHISQA